MASNFDLIKIKLKKLEEENDTLTQKLLQIPKEFENKNTENNLLKNENESNNNINKNINPKNKKNVI